MSGQDGSPRRLVVGMSGASGAIYGIRALQVLARQNVETHLVVSKAAALTIAMETPMTVREVRGLADHAHAINNVAAPVSSGSFQNMGMLIAPCSVRTLAEIATGVTTTLLTRAADVALKERRRLVLLLRETPLTLTHIRNMATVTEMGGIIALPTPSFYTMPSTLDDIVDETVGRVLDLFGIDSGLVHRWEGAPSPRAPRADDPGSGAHTDAAVPIPATPY
ncbi:UbiX family flavin prenyltransferase [Microtetraspora fusca]|uniref:Flavin prenyltransferase UbiX n=1 Tax=Microtetraspora fusca TaxID=1997 RepID=A0ABW6V2U9_MICFU